MGKVNIGDFAETVVIHFQTEREGINAYTLASTLVALADAAKAANAAVNPGFDVEVVVEAIGPGSFRAKLRAVYARGRNLFSNSAVRAIILGIVTNFICQQLFSEGVKVTVNTDEVIIENGDDRIIVPRQVYNSTDQAKQNPAFRSAMARVFKSVSDDEAISGVGFVSEMDSEAPEIIIPRAAILSAAGTVVEDPNQRFIEEQCDLDIVKAILEPGRRKWEFIWRGVRISAPVLDPAFHKRFGEHEVKIAPGDKLQVRLSIKQTRDPKLGIYTNQSYEVSEVYKHIPGLRQLPMPHGDDADR